MGGGVISFWSTLLVFVSLKPKTSKCLEAKEVLEQLILYSLPKHNFKTIVRQIFLIKIQLIIHDFALLKYKKMYKTRLILLNLTPVK